MTRSAVQLIVFDLDGTLVDSHGDLADATNALLADLGRAPISRDVVKRMVGDGAAVLVTRALSEAGLDPATPGALDRFLEHYDQRLLATTRPYHRMVDTLEALRPAHRLAVLTNKPTQATLRVLIGLDLLEYFAPHVTGGDTRFGRKPDPAGMLDLIALTGATPETTLLVGDSPVDLATARRAGTRLCLARYGFGFRFADGDLRGDESIIDEPWALVDVVARLNGQT